MSTGSMQLHRQVQACTSAVEVTSVAGGHQSQVFELTFADGRRAIAKVLDATLVDPALVTLRVEVVAELADLDDRVCAPMPVRGRFVNELVGEDGHDALLICSEFAAGTAIDEADPHDARLMGRALAGLHRSLSRLDHHPLPCVAALQATHEVDGSDVQLLHGDFNSGNVRRDGSNLRVFDFDDCGYGPRLFDVANALYMVLFSATIEQAPERFDSFERSFVAGYTHEWGEPVDAQQVTHLMDLRVAALAGWVAAPSIAPVGIRTATPEWHRTLQSFVAQYALRQR